MITNEHDFTKARYNHLVDELPPLSWDYGIPAEALNCKLSKEEIFELLKVAYLARGKRLGGKLPENDYLANARYALFLQLLAASDAELVYSHNQVESRKAPVCSEETNWVAEVPVPSAARLRLEGVYLGYGNNWNGFCERKLEVANGAVAFSLPADYSPQTDASAMDCNVFFLEARFKNSTGTRTESLSTRAIQGKLKSDN
jgi:hypothetical protein